jgi:peptidoglycan hydrolase FlgJ
MSVDFNIKAMDASMLPSRGVAQAQAAADKAKTNDDAKLRQACNDFESILVTQMFTKMRTAGPKADLFGSGDKEEMFQSMLDEERAKELCKNDFMKIGDVMYRQLTGAESPQVSGESVDTHTGKDSG